MEPSSPSHPQPSIARCDRCRKGPAYRQCIYSEYGKKCDQCRKDAKGCTINHRPVKIVFADHLRNVPDAADNWYPSHHPSSSPQKTPSRPRRYQKRKRQIESSADSNGTADEGEVEDNDNDDDSQRLSSYKHTRGNTHKQQQQEDSRDFTSSSAQPRYASRVETDSENHWPSIKQSERKAIAAHTLSREQVNDKQNEREVDCIEELTTTVSQLENHGNRMSGTDVAEDASQRAETLFDKDSDREEIYTQLKDSIFAPYADTPGHMEIIRQIDILLKRYGIVRLEKQIDEHGNQSGNDTVDDVVDPKPAGCCDKAYYYFDQKPQITAKVLEAWFIQELSHEAAWETIDLEDDPRWYTRGTTVIFSIFDYTKPEVDSRLFVLEVDDDDDGGDDGEHCYYYAEVLGKRPLNLYSQAQLERGLIPDGEEEWFLRRGGIDVKCGVHAKEFNVVCLEYFSRE